ncbi:unnamed protein product [Linum trigynum]|uniref:Uncharacterized protein n=1 Tax=Linum trigynum TaxID=586398 RepID=A0AAV2CFR8_9ROSI
MSRPAMHVPLHEDDSPLMLDDMHADEEAIDSVVSPGHDLADIPSSPTQPCLEDSPLSTSPVPCVDDTTPSLDDEVASASQELVAPPAPRRNPIRDRRPPSSLSIYKIDLPGSHHV